MLEYGWDAERIMCVEDVRVHTYLYASQRNTLSTYSEERSPFVTSLEPQDNFLAKIAGSVLQDCGELWIKRSHAISPPSTGGHGELHNR